MADEEPDEEFQSTESGASHTYPMEAGQIRKGGHIMIKGNPCKVSDVSTSKTGKHGHAKCHFVAIDIFTGKKMEDLVPAGHTTAIPVVKKEEFQCIDADEDGFVTVLLANGETRSDLKLPDSMKQEPPGAKELSDKIRKHLADEVDFYVIMQSACGTEQIMDVKVMTN
jgi:translation initiation factor 5A